MKRFTQIGIISTILLSFTSIANATSHSATNTQGAFILDKMSIAAELRASFAKDMLVIEDNAVQQSLTDMLAKAELTSTANEFLSAMNAEIKLEETIADE